MQRAKQVTAKDIALAVGVSRQAVSAVLSGSNPGCVSAAVREKITGEASRLGYRPNTAALRLAGHKTKQIGLLLGGYGFALGYPTMLANEIRKLGYRPVLMIANNTKEADDAARELHSGAYDGIFIGTQTSWQHRDFRVPTVIQEYSNCDIKMDFTRAGAMAAEHMLEQNYSNLCFLSLVPNRSVDDKLSGVEQTAGRSVTHICCSQVADPAQNILEEISRQKRTGFICTDDILAARLVNFLHGNSIDIPRKAGIIGYGGYHYGTMVEPALTTLVFPAEEIARTAARLLVDKVNSNNLTGRGEVITFEPYLRVGGTTSQAVLSNDFNKHINDLCKNTN